MMILSPFFANDVHHVDSHDNRDAKLHQLCGQIQVTLQVSSVYDVQDRIRTLGNQIVLWQQPPPVCMETGSKYQEGP